MDPAGEEHGPVPFTKLLGWYKKGHFPDGVKVGFYMQWKCAHVWHGGSGVMMHAGCNGSNMGASGCCSAGS